MSGAPDVRFLLAAKPQKHGAFGQKRKFFVQGLHFVDVIGIIAPFRNFNWGADSW